MSAPTLTVGRGVIAEVARQAALEIPEVLRVARGGPPWVAMIAGSPVTIRTHRDRVDIRICIIARPGASIPEVATRVRAIVGAAVERQLGLTVGDVVVVVDGVGG